MTDALAQLLDRIQLQTTKKFVRNMVQAGFPVDQIVSLAETTDEVVQKIMDDIAAGNQPQHT